MTQVCTECKEAERHPAQSGKHEEAMKVLRE